MPEMPNDVIAQSITRNIQQSILKLCNEQIHYRHSLQVLGVLSLTVDEKEEEAIIKINSTLKRTDVTSQQHAELQRLSDVTSRGEIPQLSNVTSLGNAWVIEMTAPEKLQQNDVALSDKSRNPARIVTFSTYAEHLLDMTESMELANGVDVEDSDEELRVEPKSKKGISCIISTDKISNSAITESQESFTIDDHMNEESSRKTEHRLQEAVGEIGGSFGKVRGRKQRCPIKLEMHDTGEATLNPMEEVITKKLAASVESSSFTEVGSTDRNWQKNGLNMSSNIGLCSVEQSQEHGPSSSKFSSTFENKGKSSSMINGLQDSSFAIDLSDLSSTRDGKIPWNVQNNVSGNVSATCGFATNSASSSPAKILSSNHVPSSFSASALCALNLSPRKSSSKLNVGISQCNSLSTPVINLSNDTNYSANLSHSAASIARPAIEAPLSNQLSTAQKNSHEKYMSQLHLNRFALSESNNGTSFVSSVSRYNTAMTASAGLPRLPTSTHRNGRQYFNGLVSSRRYLDANLGMQTLSVLNRRHADNASSIGSSTIPDQFFKNLQTEGLNSVENHQEVALNFSLCGKNDDGNKAQKQIQQLDGEPVSYLSAYGESSGHALPPRSWDLSRSSHWHDIASRVGPLPLHAERGFPYPPGFYLSPSLQNYFPGSAIEPNTGFDTAGSSRKLGFCEELLRNGARLDPAASLDNDSAGTPTKALKRKRMKQAAGGGDQESSSPSRPLQADQRLEGRYLLDSMTSPDASRKRRRRGADETLTIDEIAEYMGGTVADVETDHHGGSTSPEDTKKQHRGAFGCRYCSDVFCELDAYLGHTVATHGAYICHECGKIFTTKSSLLRHRPIHTGVRRFTCAICGRTFYRKDKCKAHIKKHLEVNGEENGDQEIRGDATNGIVGSEKYKSVEANGAMMISGEFRRIGSERGKRRKYDKVKDLSVRRRCREKLGFLMGKKLKMISRPTVQSAGNVGHGVNLSNDKIVFGLDQVSSIRKLDFSYSTATGPRDVECTSGENLSLMKQDSHSEKKRFDTSDRVDNPSDDEAATRACKSQFIRSNDCSINGIVPEKSLNREIIDEELLITEKDTRDKDETEFSRRGWNQESQTENEIFVVIKPEREDSDDDYFLRYEAEENSENFTSREATAR